MTISSQSETFVFCSLSRPSSRVSTHAFFSWNPADGVEQLKHVWLLSSLEKEVLQDWNWRGWWRTVCFPQAWAKIAGCNIFCRIQNLFWREEREMQNTDSRWRACSFLWWLAEIFIYLFIYYLHNRMWLWVWIAIFYSWSIRLAINCFMLMDCALFRSAGFSESWWCVGSCALTGWELFGEFKKMQEERSPFCSLQFGFSPVSGIVQRRKKINIPVITVFNIEHLSFKLLLFIYSYMCILALVTSEREFLGFIFFPQGRLSTSESQRWQPVFCRGSVLEAARVCWSEWELLAVLSRAWPAPALAVPWAVPGR